jgi:protein-S-isoprenylcysteine O-methyltransferase Ste14
VTSSPPPAQTPARPEVGKRRIPVAAARALSIALFAGIAWAVWAARPSWAMLVSGGIWVAFLVYWSAKARAPTPTVKAETQRSSLKHGAWREVGLLLLFLPVPLLNGIVLPNGPLHPFVGLAVQLLGAWFYLYAKGFLGRQWSGAISIKTEHELITSGPYRRIRHPMYTGMIAMALGTAIVSTRLHAVVGAVLVAVSYVIKIGIEEVWLGEHFGPAYEEWRRHSWKLLPPIY